MMILFDQIPAELCLLRQWCLWRTEPDESGKPTKVPYQTNARKASSTDPHTWNSFKAVREAYEEHPDYYSGIGFFLTPPYVGIDLDDCVGDDGESVEMLRALGGYSEFSPSGLGYHAIVKGRKPGKDCRVSWNWNGNEQWAGQIECYDHARFFCFTGNRHPSICFNPIPERQAELDAWYLKVFGRNGNGVHAEALRSTWTKEQIEAQRAKLPDADLLRLARGYALNGAKFRKLFDRGDTSDYQGDDSAADSALVAMLTFYAGPDPERIDKLFKQSKLYREKWDERRGATTYGYRTIDQWLSSGKATVFYEPHAEEGAIELEGPRGMKATVGSVHLGAKFASVSIRITLSDGVPLAYSVSDTPTGLHKMARELVIIAESEFQETIRFLRMVVAKARTAEEKRAEKRKPTEGAREILLAAAAALKPVWSDERERIYSETCGRPLYQRQFVERLISTETIDKLMASIDFDGVKRVSVIGGAKRLAEETFAHLIATLPEQADAKGLGADSKAARDARKALLEILHQPRGSEQASLAGLADTMFLDRGEVKRDTVWKPVRTPFALWARRDENGDVRLSARFGLLKQCGIVLPGIHDQASFGAVLERYGILAPADWKTSRCGHGRSRVRQFSADFMKDVSASLQVEEVEEQ
jgi:hypothetical protein